MSSIPQTSGRLHGIIPPLVTPLKDSGNLDAGGLERLIEHLITGGVHGLFVLGSTGEAASLPDLVRLDVVVTACRLARGRVPVIVGITHTCFDNSVEFAKVAADQGAHAVVLSTPYYYLLGQDELAGYIERMVERVSLPVLLYNIPQLTKVRMEPQTLRRVLRIDRIIGIKDSSHDVAYLDEVLALARERPDWTVLVGAEALLADAIAKGGHGGVCGGANLAPRLFVDLYDAALAGDAARVASLRQRISDLGRAYRLGPHLPDSIRGMKAALSLIGICNDRMAEPFTAATPAEREQIRQALEELGLLRSPG